MAALQSSTDEETTASMKAFREVLQDKLKNHHTNLVTLRCEEALAERKRVCRMLGLLRKEDEHLVKSLTEPLPLANVQRTFNEQDEIEDIFITPKTPSYVPQHYPGQYCPLSPPMISRVADVPLLGDDNDDQQTAARNKS